MQEQEDTVLDEEMINVICSDEQEDIMELEAEIEDLEYQLDEAEELLDDIKRRVKKGIDGILETADELEENMFYEEPPSDETVERLRDIAKELKEILSMTL